MGDEFKYIPVFCAAFMLTFAVARALVWSRVGKADRMQKWMFSSSTASFCHGSVTATMAFLQLRANYPFLGKMDAPNSPEQELLLQISTGYMLSDSFYMIFFDPDLLFILHHIITIVYMTWCISIGQGALSCLLLMFMGEITRRVVFRALTPLYTVFFVVVRTFVGPVYVWALVEGLHASGTLPAAAKHWWSALAVGGTVGSVGWSYKMCKFFIRWARGTDMIQHKKPKGHSKYA